MYLPIGALAYFATSTAWPPTADRSKPSPGRLLGVERIDAIATAT
jgi:hypothetical protein